MNAVPGSLRCAHRFTLFGTELEDATGVTTGPGRVICINPQISRGGNLGVVQLDLVAFNQILAPPPKPILEPYSTAAEKQKGTGASEIPNVETPSYVAVYFFGGQTKC